MYNRYEEMWRRVSIEELFVGHIWQDLMIHQVEAVREVDSQAFWLDD